MRKLAALLASVLASIPQMIWNGTKWIASNMFPKAPGGQAAYAEDALAELAASQAAIPALHEAKPGPDSPEEYSWGHIAWRYALAARAGSPEPDMAGTDEEFQVWCHSLTEDELARVVEFGPSRVEQHVWGRRRIEGLSACMEIPRDRLLAVGEHPYVAALAPDRVPLGPRIDDIIREAREDHEAEVAAYRPR